MLTRSSLEESPLADLHVLASELGIDGYRRLRKADLIDAIAEKSGGIEEDGVTEDGVTDEGAGDDAEEERPARRRGRRGGRSRSRDADPGAEDDGDAAGASDT